MNSLIIHNILFLFPHNCDNIEMQCHDSIIIFFILRYMNIFKILCYMIY